MTREQVRKHLELERLMGLDFLPGSKGKAPAKPAAPETKVREEVPWLGEWREFREKVLECTKCRLCEKRTQVVFGVGSLTAPLLFIGEGPGEKEDQQGEPFVGRSGQLLTKTLRKLGVKRTQVYIANIVKCRPPGNRTPQHDEVLACMPYLQRQIRYIKPKIICTLGGPATQAMLNSKRGITSMRGRYHIFNNMKIFPTFHPAYILRNMNNMGILEADLSKVCRDSGLI